MTYLNLPYYVFPVGRLDKDSEGLLFLTNDGELANQLLDADHFHEKVYEVTLDRPYDQLFMEKMASGVPIDGKMTRPCTIEKLTNETFKITLSQGLNRQIRKMCAFWGYKVLRLRRTEIVTLKMDDLAYGDWRELSLNELKLLKRALQKV